MEKNRFKKSKSENEKKNFCLVLNDEQAISFFVSKQNKKTKANYIREGERGLPVICNVIYIRMDWEGTIQVISVPSFVGFKPYSYRFMFNTRYRIQDTGSEQNTRSGYRTQQRI